MDVPLATLKKDGIAKFYKINHSEFSKYINSNSILIPLGSALSAATGDDNLHIYCFTDWLCGWEGTRFYSKKFNCYVYPIFGLNTIMMEDKQGIIRPRQWSKTNFSSEQIKKASTEQLINCNAPREPKIIKLSTKEEASAFLTEHIGKEELLSWDLETDGLDFRKNKIGCITMSFDGQTGYFIPWRLVDTELLNKFFIGKKGIGNLIKFDIRTIRKYGITNTYIHADTLNLAHLINEKRLNRLKSLAYYYTMFGGYDEDLDNILEGMKIKNFLLVPESILCKYATMDAIVAFQSYEVMQKQLDYIDAKYPNPYFPEWTLRRYYEEIVMPWVNESVEIELAGVYINETILEANSKIIRDRIINLKKEIYDKLKIPVEDVSSQEKLGKYLEKLGWKCLGRTKKGHYQTSDIKLEEWKKLGHKEAGMLQQMRTWETLYKTFIGSREEENGWFEYLYEGKINPVYAAMLANSHRNKCNSPNWSQIPSHGEDAKLVTSAITLPGDNFKFLTLDYMALQIKLCAIESGDKVLTEIYKKNLSGGDLHSITGYNIFCKGKPFSVHNIKLTLDTGAVIEVLGSKKIKVLRNEKEIKIMARDIIEGDELL